MQTIRDQDSLKAALKKLRSGSKRLALVPTMGALHEGHLSLVRLAKTQADAVMATIFVNPKQFGPNEDLARYPRSEHADCALLKEEGVDAVYIPDLEDTYPPGFSTRVEIEGVSNILEGAFRPGFFTGVATVLMRFFWLIQPDIAVFGEKDYQQLYIIRRMVRDMDIPITIIAGPTVREKDGLAMASRNRYLSAAERAIAPQLYAVLQDTAERLKKGADAREASSIAKQRLLKAGFSKVDYLTLRDAETLEEIPHLRSSARLLVAVQLGTTRLIDNIAP